MMDEGEIKWNEYYIPGTTVFKNKLGITNEEELQQVEADITFQKLLELYDNPIAGNFDVEHFRTIHKYLFEDIYYFAGEFRNVEMHRYTTFANSKEIEFRLNAILKEMQEDILKCQSYQQCVSFLAQFYYSLTDIHPFREGNGRTIREFLREFVDIYMPQYKLRWSKMDKKALLEGLVYGIMGKGLLEIEFRNGLVDREEKISR